MVMPETPGSKQTVRIDTSFFTPEAAGRYPAVMLAHGFGGSKDDMTGQAEQLARDGDAVLTWSARGFGRSTGAIGLDAPDREVADVSRLIDWLGHRSDVLQDGPDDPRVGIAGASYGGAIALLAAGYDKRVDAIAPQMTWWNLPDALFPQAAQGEPADSGVFKKLWAGIFFTTGSTGTTGTAAGTVTAVGGGTAGPGGASGGTTCPRRPARVRRPEQVRRRGFDELPLHGRTVRALPAGGGLRARRRRGGQASGSIQSLVGRQPDQGAHSGGPGPERLALPTGPGRRDGSYVAANGAPVSVDWTSGGHDGGDQETSRIDAPGHQLVRPLPQARQGQTPVPRSGSRAPRDSTPPRAGTAGRGDRRPVSGSRRDNGSRGPPGRRTADGGQPGRWFTAGRLRCPRHRRSHPTRRRGRGFVGRLPGAVGCLRLGTAAVRADLDRVAARARDRRLERARRLGGALRQGLRRRAERKRDPAAPTRRADADHGRRRRRAHRDGHAARGGPRVRGGGPAASRLATTTRLCLAHRSRYVPRRVWRTARTR